MPNEEELRAEAQKEELAERVAAAVKEANATFNALMESAHAAGNAIWQKDIEERSAIHAPILIYRDKDGEAHSFYPPASNTLPALQHAANIESKDNRWIGAKEAAAHPDITIRKGAKAMDFILFTKDKKPYVKKFFNYADVSGKGVPELTPEPELSRDVYAREMVNYLARRTERGTFKDDNYFLMFMDAKEAANRSYATKKNVFDFATIDAEAYRLAEIEADHRMKAILNADEHVPESESSYEKNFLGLLRKELGTKSKEPYVVRAARKAVRELHWSERIVAVAIKGYVPQAAFDDLSRAGKTPSTTIMKAAFKDLEQKKEKTKAAVR